MNFNQTILKRKSSIFAYTLIFIFLLNSGMYVLLYFSSLKVVKKTIHYLIEKDEFEKELFIFSISKKDVINNTIKFERIDENEFRFNGQMYDIKKDLSDADSLRFLCYMDKYENLLEQLLHRFDNSSKESKSNQPLKIIFYPFLSLYFHQTDSSSRNIELIAYCFYESKKLLDNFIEINTPPPKFSNLF